MKACYPGSFDPITNGHLDIIERASKMFEEVIVLIMENPRKRYVFTVEERKQMIVDSFASIGNPKNVKVLIGNGLTVHLAHEKDCGVIIRGIRAVSDYEYELQIATANMKLQPDIETMFLIAKPEYSFLSSSVVKEISMNHGDVTSLLPEQIIDRVNEKMWKDEN